MPDFNPEELQTILLKERNGEFGDAELGALSRLRAQDETFPPALPIRTPRSMVPTITPVPGGVMETGGAPLGQARPAGFEGTAAMSPGDRRTALTILGGTGGAVLSGPASIPGAAAGGFLGSLLAEENDPTDQPLQTAIAEGALQGAGQAIGMGVGAGVRGGIRLGVRGGRQGVKMVRDAIRDLAPFGVSPSVAQATSSPAFDTAEQFLSRTLGASGVIRRRVAETTAKVSQSVDALAQRVARQTNLDPEVSGRVVKNAFEKPGGFVERFKIKASQRFDRLNGFIRGDEIVPVSNLTNTLDDITVPIAGAEATSEALLVNPTLRRTAEAVTRDVEASGGQGLSFEALQGLRSRIGRQLGDAGLFDDIPRAELKRLYAALTRDMEAAATAKGPEALNAFKSANNFYNTIINAVDDFVAPVIKADAPEKVFLALERAGKQGATSIRTIRRGLTPAQWGVVQGSVIKRLGRTRAGQQTAVGEAGEEAFEFSFETFLTNWNALPAGTKQALFSGTKAGNVRPVLDGLGRAAARMRESSRAFANPSGTAGSTIAQGAITGGAVFGQAQALQQMATGEGPGLGTIAFLAPAAAMTALEGAGVAKLLTSPRFVNWLAKSTNLSGRGFAAHLGRLSGVAANEDLETRKAILQFLGAFERASEERQ